MQLPYADKSFGQHFLNDQEVIQDITQDHLASASGIIEIGPGPGILTKILSNNDVPLHVIEMDLRFRPYLEEILSEDQITFDDALAVNLTTYISDRFSNSEQENLWLVSNLPYNISVPLTLTFLKHPEIKYMTLMFQKEVGEKILNHKKKVNNNSLYTLCSNFFEISELAIVPPESFTPPPKVDSIVLSFKRKKNPVISIEGFKPFERFLRNLFQHKRKQIQKVLKNSYPVENIRPALETSHIDSTLRAEKLTMDQVYDLYKNLLGDSQG